MGLTRKYLKEIGIESEKIDLIVEAHTEVVDALKAQRDEYKEGADKVKALEDKVKQLKETAKTDSEWKNKYEKEHADYEAYKSQLEAEKETASKNDAYRQLLKEAGISEKRIDAIMKVTKTDELVVVDGKLKDSAEISKKIKEEWADFIVTSSTSGAQTTTPPGNAQNNTDLGTLSMEDYIKARTKN